MTLIKRRRVNGRTFVLTVTDRNTPSSCFEGEDMKGTACAKAATGVRGGLTERCFQKIAPNGFGDGYNAYPHSMTWFGGHLYVGTTRANLAYRGQWHSQDNPDWLGQVWPVRIPKGSFDIDLRAQIWRYDPTADEWTHVFVSPLVKGRDGFDVPLSIAFRAMTPFQGKSDSAPALYVPTWGSHQTPETFMLRSIDGLNFELLPEAGLGLPDPKPRALRGLVSFKNRLFASPAVGQQRKQPNIASVMTVLVSSDPVKGKWEVACEPYFGNPNNLTVFQMAEFNGYLFAGTLNINEGFQIWKTNAEGRPPYEWKRVLTHGAYRGKLNQVAMTLQPFGNHLYVGTAIQDGGFDVENQVGPAAPEIIRINADDSWDLIVGEPRVTPDGLKVPLSGSGPGFENPFAGYLWSMCVHEGWLYAGNSVWSLFLRYSRMGDRWPARIREMLDQETIEELIFRSGGCDLWRTHDGSRWNAITRNGFENVYNMGIRNMVSTPHGLFVGVANPFGPEVAIKRLAGWTYEMNTYGGLEIWLGTELSNPILRSLPKGVSESNCCEHPFRHKTAKKEHKSEDKIEEIISDFYRGSGFRQFGLWCLRTRDPKSACENLMDEMLAFITHKKGKIINIACHRGETTKYLLKYWSPEKILGITTSMKELADCMSEVPNIKFLCMKLPKIHLPSESFDCAIWVSSHGLPNDRFKSFKECFRLLSPGGKLICFDVLYESREKVRSWKTLRAPKAQAMMANQYQDMLLEAGYRDVTVVDVTDNSFDAFRRYTKNYFKMKGLSGQIDLVTVEKIEDYLLISNKPNLKCFLISGLKPEKELTK